MLGAVHVQGQRTPLDDGGLTRARLVARRVAGTAGDGARGQRVARDLGAQAGQRRGEDLVGVAAGAAAATLAGRTTETMPSSSRRSSCESRSSSPEAILLATCSVGLVSPRSTCESIGAETPERSASSRSERSIASRSAFTRGPTAAMVGSAAAAITLVRYHVRAAA